MNWRVRLAENQTPSWMVGVLLVSLICAVLCWWLLESERRLVPARVGRTLLFLRLLTLLVFLLMMLQPVLSRRSLRLTQGRIAVAIDVSESMRTRDQHASLPEKIRWAQALGMLGTERSAALLDEWATARDSAQDPDRPVPEKSEDTSADRELADAVRLQVTSATDELDQMTRVEFVRRLLSSPPYHLLQKWSDEIPLDLHLFAARQQAVSAADLDDSLRNPAEQLNPNSTDAAQLLAGFAGEAATGDLRGVVVISDGRHTGSTDAVAEAARLGGLNVPVFTIPVGSRRPPRDLSILTVESPAAVFLNDRARIDVTLGTAGFEGQDIVVRLVQDGVTLDQQTVIPSADTAQLSFAVPTSAPGRASFQIVAEPQPDELRDDNNTRSLSLQVTENKARVMLVDGDARWEFRYLNNLLQRDPQVALSAVLFRQPRVDRADGVGISRTLPDGAALAERLNTSDVLILGDVSSAQLSQSDLQQIEHAVADEGLTLIVLPGRRYMPHGYHSETLNSLLPTEETHQRLAESYRRSDPDGEPTEFRLELTDAAAQLPMFQLAPDGSDQSKGDSGAKADFRLIPGHPWACTATPRVSATVWATVALPGREGNPEAVVIHHFYGFGQVVWMGIDSTWRWRMRAGDDLHHRFWGQLVRWAARNKAAAGNDQVRLNLSTAVTDQAESVEVTARWSETAARLLTDTAVEVVVAPGDSAAVSTRVSGAPAASPEFPANAAEPNPAGERSEQIVVLRPSAENPGRYAGRLPRLTDGTWTVRLRVRGGTLQLNDVIENELVVRAPVSAELAGLSCNRQLLQQVAAASGGAMIEPDQASELIRRIRPQDHHLDQSGELDLWNHPAMLLMFCLMLTGEWAVRKLNGLP